MKRLIILICILLSYTHVNAQPDTIYVWNKWCSRKDTMLLFNSGNNLIQITSAAFKPADIKLKSLDVSLRIGTAEAKGDTTTVLAMPYPAKGKNMRLAILNKKTNKTIKIINFTSDEIPELIAHVGTIQASEAARKDILSQLTLRTSFPKSLYSYPYHIKSYTFKISTPKGNATINAKGFFMTQEMFQQIKDAPAGTVIDFTNIQATCPECATRTLPDITLKIR